MWRNVSDRSTRSIVPVRDTVASGVAGFFFMLGGLFFVVLGFEVLDWSR